MIHNIVICPPATLKQFYRHLYKFTFLSGQSNTEVWNAKLTYTQFILKRKVDDPGLKVKYLKNPR